MPLHRSLLAALPVRLILGGAAALGLAAVLAGCNPYALTLVVNSPGDGPDADPGDGICEMTAGVGDCGLRSAIDEANASVDPVLVEVPSGTYTLMGAAGEDVNGSGDLDLTNQIEIRGTEAGVVVDGGGTDRVFDVHPGGNLRLAELTVTGGHTTGDGGGVRSQGTFSTAAVSIENNVAGSAGGGVAVWNGLAVFGDTTLANNTAGRSGGGVLNSSSGDVVMSNSTVSGNVVSPAAAGAPPSAVPEPDPGPQGIDAASGIGAPSAEPDADSRVPVIVELDLPAVPEGSLAPGAVADQRATIAASAAGLVDTVSSDPVVDAQIDHVLRSVPYVSMIIDEAGRDRLERLPGVRSVHDDSLGVPLLDVSIPLIGADTAHAAGHDGAGTTVVVLDTGVDTTHVMMSPRVVAEACFARGEDTTDEVGDCPNGLVSQIGTGAGVPCPPTVTPCYHGTHVASIAAGSAVLNGSTPLTGVAPSADIISINVNSAFLTNCGGAPVPCAKSFASDQIAALDHVAVSLAPLHDIAAVNMSLGGGAYTAACDGDVRKPLIDNLRSLGIATVVASGNSGTKNAIAAPACISTAISVGNTTDADAVAASSASADMLDLLAPGFGIVAARPGNLYWANWGTSMSAPHVAGTVALLHDSDPEASVEEILSAMTSTGVPVTDPRNGLTKPRIDVPGALTVLADGIGGGGGIANFGTFHLQHATITDNSAPWGGGIHNNGEMQLSATVIAGQASGYDCALDNDSAHLSHGANADSDGSCDLEDPSDLSGIAPQLGALAPNGAFPDSHLPAPSSPLVDAMAPGAPPTCDGTVAVDQRGFVRPIAAGCDIGSTEQ